MTTKNLRALLCGAALIAMTGCSAVTPQAKPTGRSAQFATWPAAVQKTVMAGQVDKGFTREQVQDALGNPDYKRAGESEVAAEIWGYRDSRPRAEYGFRPVAKVERQAEKPDQPKFVVFFDRRGQVAALENPWW